MAQATGTPWVRRILVATDGSDPSIEACRALSGFVDPRGTQVRLVTVLSSGRSPAYGLDAPFPTDPSTPEALAERGGAVSEKSRRVLEDAGFHVEVAYRVGNAADGILDETRSWNPDLLVMGRRGLGMPARWLMGSVSDRVLRNTSVPALVAS